MNADWEEAAARLWRSASSGEGIDMLPSGIRPVTRADGYAVQALVAQTAGNVAVAGWKIAATSQAGRDHIRVSGPLAGRILAPFVHDVDAVLPLIGNRMRVAELEFAFTMGRDLPPRATPYAVDEVLAAVTDLRPAIEVPSSRFLDFEQAGEAQLIADCACAGRFVFGAPVRDAWRTLDLSRHEVLARVERGGGVVLQRMGSGANVLDDPRKALAWLASELSAHGETLRAGQIVSTGTCMPPVPIEPGDRVCGDFGSLGGVAARLAVRWRDGPTARRRRRMP